VIPLKQVASEANPLRGIASALSLLAMTQEGIDFYLQQGKNLKINEKHLCPATEAHPGLPFF
jgi:hypothetical protein